MKNLFLSIFLAGIAMSGFAKPIAEKPKTDDFNVQKAAKKIDALVEAGLKKNKVKPNSSIDDETFLRRAFVDIAGRIPTIEEAENFQGSTYDRKRSQLISDLLESDGAVSHGYNFWADVLRINNALGGASGQAEAAYQLWLKNALDSNKPYDEFVQELVSATGKVWDNGAIGYYVRDRGMPLDNMSNTVRVFLGTRLECAQCHDHPFDKWTQMDYFKMAAFSYGMDARSYSTPNRTAMSAHQKEKRNEMFKEMVSVEKFPQITRESQIDSYMSDPKKKASYLKRYDMTEKEFRAMGKTAIAAYDKYQKEAKGVGSALNELYNPLRYVSATENDKKVLKLPHDYQYSDAKPLSPVTADTMFGEKIDLANVDDGAAAAYANWMTSKENPTFTKVIANRLWKKVFGHGVFEPVDEITDHTVIANPELLAFLEKTMRELDYDMRKYQEVLYNTKTYQRGTNQAELVLGEPYHFQGPTLRRMSAEQIWDSIVALALPEADSYRPRLKTQLTSVDKVRRIYDALEGRDEDKYIKMVEEIGDKMAKSLPKQQKIRDEMYVAREADDEDKYRKLRGDLSVLQRETRSMVADIGYKNVGEKVDSDSLLAAIGMSEMAMGMSGDTMEGGASNGVVLTKLPQIKTPKYEAPERPEGLDKTELRAWQKEQAAVAKKWKYDQSNALKYYKSLVSQMARASELESPARRGHFLREFGQSDREVIENAAYHASVPQALNLLNGTIVEALTNQFAVFGSRLKEAGDPEEKTKMIFQAMLTREPTEHEMKIAKNEIEQHGDEAYSGIVWALLNTQQFIFVQ
ncbi:DUF1549 and DUF1553 domain-containing protein [Verrucomicrobiales bacterium]|nr:DUF1549 and DUF1553 domain-containing protein [Verrucomicrobiales bacterium]